MIQNVSRIVAQQLIPTPLNLPTVNQKTPAGASWWWSKWEPWMRNLSITTFQETIQEFCSKFRSGKKWRTLIWNDIAQGQFRSTIVLQHTINCSISHMNLWEFISQQDRKTNQRDQWELSITKREKEKSVLNGKNWSQNCRDLRSIVNRCQFLAAFDEEEKVQVS